MPYGQYRKKPNKVVDIENYKNQMGNTGAPLWKGNLPKIAENGFWKPRLEETQENLSLASKASKRRTHCTGREVFIQELSTQE